jgi:transketolase
MQDVAVMRSLPNMTVIDPVDAVETRLAVRAATDFDGPVYLRTTRHESPVILDPATYRFTWGKALLLRPGNDVTLIGTGTMSVLALEAAEALATRGVNARVLHVHTVKPLDEEAILSAARETGRIVTVENHSIIGGLGSAVCETVCAGCPVPVHRVGFPDVFGESGDDGRIYDAMGLSVRNVIAHVMQVLKEHVQG